MNWLQMTESEILAIANPIMDNLMQASTNIDHELHVRDFTDQLKTIVTEESLLAQREFVGVFRKETDTAIFWRQKYTKSSGEHIAFLRLIDVEGKILVQNVSVT